MRAGTAGHCTDDHGVPHSNHDNGHKGPRAAVSTLLEMVTQGRRCIQDLDRRPELCQQLFCEYLPSAGDYPMQVRRCLAPCTSAASKRRACRLWGCASGPTPAPEVTRCSQPTSLPPHLQEDLVEMLYRVCRHVGTQRDWMSALPSTVRVQHMAGGQGQGCRCQGWGHGHSACLPDACWCADVWSAASADRALGTGELMASAAGPDWVGGCSRGTAPTWLLAQDLDLTPELRHLVMAMNNERLEAARCAACHPWPCHHRQLQAHADATPSASAVAAHLAQAPS